MSINSNSLSDYNGWNTRRALFFLAVGLWLWICVASHASDPSAAPPTGVGSATTLQPIKTIESGFPSASTGTVSQAVAPSTPGVISAPDSDDMAGLDNRRDLAIGDRLLFRIIEDDDAPKELVVNDSGEIEAPYVGRVRVRGMTCKQLAVELKKKLEAKYYRQATVIISVETMSQSLGKVYISGAVHTPGPLEIPGNEVFTVSKAILCAGGFADFADKHSVKVTRRSKFKSTNDLFSVDVGQILEKGRTELDVPLKPGDMIFVPERLIRF